MQQNTRPLRTTNETFTVTLSSPTNSTISNATATGTILKDDSGATPTPTPTPTPTLPILEIFANQLNIDEGNAGSTSLTFTVTRTGNTTGISTANWRVTGTGTNPATANDFVGGVFPSGTVTFAAGQTSQVITVNIQGDTVVEQIETFSITLSNPSNATISDMNFSATGVIFNDDFVPVPPPSLPTLAIAATNATRNEGNSGTTSFTFTVTRTGDTTGQSDVDWEVTGTGSNPASPNDFLGGTYPSGFLTFEEEDISKTISINVQGDTLVENDEQFTVTLKNPWRATITTATATGTIQNDDTETQLPNLTLTNGEFKNEGNSGTTPFTFTVTRTGNTTGTSSANWAVTGTGDNPANAADFGGTLPTGIVIFTPGVTSQVITVNVQGDTVAEPDETFTVTLFNPTNAIIPIGTNAPGIILNDDIPPSIFITSTPVIQNEGSSTLGSGNPFTFTVTRTGNTTGTSSASWLVQSTGTNPANNVDFADGILPTGTVTFNAGETTKEITVLVNRDFIVEPDETFTIILTNPVNAIIPFGSNGLGTIVNDDFNPDLSISPASITINEGDLVSNTTFTFTVTRTHGQGNITGFSSVNWRVEGTGAHPVNRDDFNYPTNFFLPSGTLTFGPLVTEQVITLNVLGDTIVEPDETFIIILSSPIDANIITATATGTIRNDD